MGKLDGKIALITGASRGIGAAVARLYAREGAHVILVARTQGALEELDDAIQADGGSATLVPLDITDGDGIDRMGAAIYERWKRLDILVANAARLGPLSPLGHIKPQAWDDLVAVNLTANWRLIRAFDPLLRASEAGRALFVTSSVGHQPRAYWGGYGTTKAALEHMARTWAAETHMTGLRVNLINPGATRTRMRAEAMPGEDPGTLPTPDDVAPLFLEMVLPTYTENGALVNYRDWARVGV
ncbi:MAG: SDR family NAD(P)-dependent oxidoreductase [Alphaproteobacteria bacterium]|nr:MAG: SDR family NAD(P)-dependent oxidoreductase [Alphaproteobacteria bacterium]